MTATKETDWVEQVGAPAYASIAEMVAALECDYDRLEELREERRAITDGESDEDLEAWDAENAERLAELEKAAGKCENREQAQQRIEEDALSVSVRSDWVCPGEDMAPCEFNILLATGGPAVRIVGDLDDNNEPCSARLEVQDWFKPWTEYVPADSDTLLAYCRCFYFGS